MVEREAPGGQAGMSSRIENYLGFPAGLSGGDLARRAVVQAKRFGVEILAPQEAVGVRVEGPYRIIKLADGNEISCHALMIATGLEEISVLCTDTNTIERVPASAVFIFIGALPRTDWLAGTVERDERGFILTGPDVMQGGEHPKGWTLERDPFLLETNVPGIFAMGDV